MEHSGGCLFEDFIWRRRSLFAVSLLAIIERNRERMIISSVDVTVSGRRAGEGRQAETVSETT